LPWRIPFPFGGIANQAEHSMKIIRKTLDDAFSSLLSEKKKSMRTDDIAQGSLANGDHRNSVC
jgi:hypothetical protein